MILLMKKMFALSLFGLTFLCLLLSCQSKEVKTETLPEKTFTLAPVNITTLEKFIPVENLFAELKQELGEKEIDVQAEFNKFCEENIELCGRGSSTSDSDSKKFKRHEILKAFKSKDWKFAEEFSTNHVVQGLRGESHKNLMTLASEIPTESCALNPARVGLGLLLERELPEPTVLDQILKLYGAQLNCSENYDVMRASLRFSLLQISKGQCALAEPHLKKLETSTDSSFRSRGIFWQKECGQREAVNQAEFPFLSFHGLRALERFQLPAIELVLNPQTPVARRLENQEGWNKAISLIEYSLLKNRIDLSRWMIERLNLNSIRNLPGETQVYFGYMAFLSGAHLRKMQILNPLVAADSRFQNRTLRDLLYPWIYQEEIAAQASAVPQEMIMALIRQESAFDLRARSRVGATGLMQLMYSTARTLDRKIQKKDLLNPEINIRLGTRYFEKLWRNFDGSAIKSLAAYNAGPLRVIEWQRRYPVENELLFAELIPFNETRDYVALVLRNFMIYQQIKLEKEKVRVGESQLQTENIYPSDDPGSTNRDSKKSDESSIKKSLTFIL